jgi:polyhydroxyalkanoate synthesis regulator phasin
MKLFGFNIEREKGQDLPALSFPENQEGAIEATSAGGAFATYLDLEAVAKTDADLIMKYRDMGEHPECDMAVENIIQEAIVTNQARSPVDLDLTHTGLSKNLQDKITDEFELVLKLLDFNNQAYDIFKRWYIEGRIFYHAMIDPKHTEKGIQELRSIDSFKIKKVRQIIPDPHQTPSEFKLPKFEEYYLFNEKGLLTPSQLGVKVAVDSIIMAHSGIMTKDKKFVISHLHKAIKSLNQLRMLEDAVVIYRIARAPERRIFYIDVGNLPKQKAEQYLKDIMTRYKNKLVYNAATGEVKDDRRHQSMLEDYWLPRREGGRGTEISTLPGGQNLGEMEDVDYFRRKLYQSLNVPLSRLEADTPFVLGRASEISRDELKFSRFIDRIRIRFSHLFYQIMEKQLILKNVIHTSEWPKLKETLRFNYAHDNHFAELKQQELMSDRLNMMRDVEELVGNYYSKQFVKDNVLRLTPEEQKRIEKEIKKEEKEAEGEGDQYPPQSGMPPAVPAVNKINVVPGADPNTGGQPFTAAGQDQGLATSQGMQASGENIKPEMLTGEKTLKGLYNLNKKERKFGK